MTILPGPGAALPDLPLTTPEGREVRVSDFAGRKLVIFFYPKDDTPGCTTESKDFSALAKDFAKAGVAVLGVSKDPPEKHRKFIEKHGLSVPLASDAVTGGLSDALGIWTEKQNYGRIYMGMVRSTFLIDSTGRIAQVWSPVKVKGHAEAVLAAAQSL